MKRKENFVLKSIANQWVIVSFGEDAVNFNGVITVNETGKLLWENMNNDFSIDSLANVLVDKYKILKENAVNDTKIFIDQLREANCIED